MLFNSPQFILGFLPLALGGFFLAGRWYGARAALVWLVAADLVFYGWWNPRYIPLLVGSVGANCLLGQRILRLAQATRAGTGRPGAARRWPVGGVCFNLGLLS
jgi:alginate O-acetyltransferase complex protein AlgI